MLKQLELIGFKSFAERTIFTFGPGITAIVGPNGSGKSNVVDAVRWIMGEQSAKSLRGDGMTDVIFNGSATRKSLGMTEVSLTLDNSKRHLTLDADEVQITRRVYRDGTGEYLINQQLARLRDIKEMFLGSGAGARAYSVIAQGQVETLLQASSQERRFILEEAAGISRFRAKKLETLRKLEEVEQNLQRVKDIHDELSRQLQAVRLQAAKAQRYREYTEELKKTSIDLALHEWHQQTQLLHQAQTDLAAGKRALDERSAEASLQERQLAELESLLAAEENAQRQAENVCSNLRERIATLEGTIHHESANLQSLEGDLAQFQQRHEHLAAQATRLMESVGKLRAESTQQDDQKTIASQNLNDAEKGSAATSKQMGQLRQQLQANKQLLYERMQEAARAHNDLVGLRTQVESLHLHRKRMGEKHAQTQGTLSSLSMELNGLEATLKDSSERIEKLREALANVRLRKESVTIQLDSALLRWTTLREQQSGLTSRIGVLQALEDSREGLGAGPRTILETMTQADSALPKSIIGVVADLILVDREHATLVDLALGDQVQAVVIHDWQGAQEALRTLGKDLPGRVSFLPLSEAPPASDELLIPGAEPLARYVSAADPSLTGVAQHLLAKTWLVKDLTSARQISAHYPGESFITRQGEIINELGMITLGPDQKEQGFLSRKSELRELNNQAVSLNLTLANCEQETHDLRRTLAELTAQEEQTEQGLQVLTEEAAVLRSRLQQKQEQGKELAEEVRLGQNEIHTLNEEITHLSQKATESATQTAAAETAAQQLQMDLQAAEAALVTLESQRQREQEATVALKVTLAQLEQSSSALHERLQIASKDYQEKRAELENLERQRGDSLTRQQTSRTAFTTASAALEACKSERAATEEKLSITNQAIQELRHRSAQLREKTHQIRQEWQHWVDVTHAREMQVSELHLRLETQSNRCWEEYEVRLAEAYSSYQPSESPLDVAATQNQISELKRKIGRLGNVSLDSLQELASLESRANDLQKQEDDLAEGKLALDEIIARINADTRRIFEETYNSVRNHFQELFRKLFGGGMADIILENPDDLLETGVDIMARPPGKEMRNMTLLSGGEKTLTAVALLLAIFQNKPSPFCILDEVDAALDEANVGRYAAVLREFLHLAQFILVTHSKKTMTAADVLYGVTMQEAGVSKRVAVRLEDYEEPAQRLAA
jgi:chromosome segregation protein